jgi:simple sugar transport system ATP-binding protein
MIEAATVVQLIGITKLFPGLVANDAVDFELKAGEIHALLGENGAGKSTLMNVLTGIYQPEAGEIRVFGQPTRFPSPAQAIAAGIGMVHQHFKLIRAFTVAENVHLGWRETPRLLSAAALEGRTAKLAARFNLRVRPEAVVRDISAGEQQRVEILRILSRGARILILDEPTAVLTPAEARELFKVLNSFKADGGAIIFISHKLDEVLEISDRVSVMRGGRKIATVPAAGCTHASLANLMVGHEVVLPTTGASQGEGVRGEVILGLAKASALDDRGITALKEVDFDVHAGEILGVAGVAGNGQRELSEVLTGVRRLAAGDIRIKGKPVMRVSPRLFRDAGIGHIPEDRLRSGIAPSLGVIENAVLREYRQPPIARGPLYSPKAAAALAGEIAASANVTVPNLAAPIRNLSGGNQQRLVARREMRIAHTALIATYPTRGLDIGAIDLMLRYLIEMRSRGVGVVLISEEIEELLGIADRIVVLYEGRIMGEVWGEKADLEHIGLMMGGKPVGAIRGPQ